MIDKGIYFTEKHLRPRRAEVLFYGARTGENGPRNKVYELLMVCSQIVYLPPLTLNGGGGKLRLALRKKEC